MRSLARPSAEVVQAYFDLCAWVLGLLSGFELRCVALLVSVGLHLVLFPAGGPFLPSLSVTHHMTGFSLGFFAFWRPCC
jgi:hypothetical protein